MKNVLSILLIGISFFACQSDAPATEQVASSTSEKTEVVPEETTVVPSFIIDSFKDELETPKSTISLDMNGKKIEVTEALACEKIAITDYKNYQIPEEAVDACGGWWAGGGNYFYIIKNPNKDYWMVMQALVDEGQSSTAYDYQSIMNITHKTK